MKTEEKEITIKAPDGYVIDQEKSTSTNIVFKLNSVFDYKNIKSFEDACKYLNINISELWFLNNDFVPKHIISELKLEIIYKAINNGWIPDFTNNQYKYAPYFTVFASGLVYYYLYCDVNYFSASSGCRLCTYNNEIAEYIGKTFIDLYKDYLYKDYLL
jgi:hypothetical protein